MRSIDSGVTATDAELVAGIAGLAAELAARPAPASGAVCYDQVDVLGRAVDLLESAIAARVGVATRCGQVAEWGHTSPTAWLRGGLGMRHVRAAERATLAEQLPRLPQVAKRLAAGELSAGYAAAIAAGVRRLDAADCGKAEGLLLRFVDEGHSVGQITRFADKIKDLIAERDDTAAEPEDGRHAERQWWTVHRSGPGAFVKGRFGPELLSLIKAKLEPLATPCGADDTRDHAERLADALQTHLSGGDSRWDPILIVDLKQQVLRQHTPQPATPHNPAPTDQFGRDADQLPGDSSDGGRESAATTAGANVADPGPPEPPTPTWPFNNAPFTARLADGTPIGMERARQILLNSGFSTLVLGTDGHPLYLGRRVRCATPAQRRVLLTRYATCAVDDCEIPATGCQIDHADGWENGQGSDIDQLVMCCAWHNKYKWRHPDRVIISRRPDGRYRYQIIRPAHQRSGRRSPGRDP